MSMEPCPDCLVIHDPADICFDDDLQRARLTAAQQEIAALKAERDTFYMDYRVKCDEQSKAALMRTEAAESQRDALREALKELHAMVLGECPSLLNEDSGGNARLAIQIEGLLAPLPADTEGQ